MAWICKKHGKNGYKEEFYCCGCHIAMQLNSPVSYLGGIEREEIETVEWVAME